MPLEVLSMDPRIRSYASKEETFCDYCGGSIHRGEEAYYLANGPFFVYCSETCTHEDASERNAAQADYPPTACEYGD
jgi:hypothetical protein